jgi:glycogen debranching enzyme
MYSGWGIRTLSTQERRFNPLGYHLGTVWPHDNALILAGLRRYGFDDAAMQVFMGIFDAATHFDQYRLPELFSGYTREAMGEPVRYPVACHPQAWAAAALPFMLSQLLGLQPEGFENRLRVVRPMLPPFVDRLEIHRLRVGAGWVSLRFERTSHGSGVAVIEAKGDIQVIVEPTIHG